MPLRGGAGMKKIKAYLYEHAPPHVHDQIIGYENSVPFSEQGIKDWCELVPAKKAELFLCGQYNDSQRWMLQPNRFEWFKGNESRHVFDLEGDQSHLSFLPWMRPCLITAMNAEPNHRNWNCLVRPGCSTLLMDMVKNPRPFTMPEETGFFFMGQVDPNGLREKVSRAFFDADVTGEFVWTNQWNAVSPLNYKDVIKYERGMKHWSFALCPAGTGQMTVRYFEACGMGRIPIVIADNLLFDEPFKLGVRLNTSLPEQILSAHLSNFQRMKGPVLDACYKNAHEHFEKEIRRYFHDPTEYFLQRMHQHIGLRLED